MLQAVGDIGGLEVKVHRHEPRADETGGEIALQIFDRVAIEHRESRALANAVREQRVREQIHARMQLGIRAAAAGRIDDGQSRRMQPRVTRETTSENHASLGNSAMASPVATVSPRWFRISTSSS